jgi:hypothetical protein
LTEVESRETTVIFLFGIYIFRYLPVKHEKPVPEHRLLPNDCSDLDGMPGTESFRKGVFHITTLFDDIDESIKEEDIVI